MAQPVATLRLHVDTKTARRAVKRVMSDAQEANRELARLEERINEMQAKLETMGIRLEVEA